MHFMKERRDKIKELSRTSNRDGYSTGSKMQMMRSSVEWISELLIIVIPMCVNLSNETAACTRFPDAIW